MEARLEVATSRPKASPAVARSVMCRAAAWNTWKTPSRLVANMLRHCSSVRSMKACRPPPPMPALAKHPSTRPNRSSVALIADLTDAGLLTSQTTLSSLPAEPAMLASAFLFLSALRPQMDTLQPAAARACAMPRPIPPLPPVMTATRPVRSKILMSVSNLVWRALSRASAGGRCCCHDHGQARPENQIWPRIETLAPQDGITRATHREETDAVQTRHA